MVTWTIANSMGKTIETAVETYHRRVAAGDAPPERVSLDLSRERGFVNRGRAGSGHTVHSDEPTDFGGEGAAADPAELLLAAVGSSLSVTLTTHAALRGLQIAGIEMRLSAWMDPAAFFIIGPNAPSGLQDLCIALKLHSSEPADVLRRLIDDAATASPVVASLSLAPKIDLHVEP